MNSMDNDTSKDESILECRLEKVRMSGHDFWLPLALQNTRIFGCLRLFMVHFFRVCPYNIRQTWNVIHITSKSFEDLRLTASFGK